VTSGRLYSSGVRSVFEELHSKQENHGFDSRWGHWDSLYDLKLPAAVGSLGRLNR